MSKNNEADQMISEKDDKDDVEAITFDEFKSSLSKSQDSLSNSQSMKKSAGQTFVENEQIQETQE